MKPSLFQLVALAVAAAMLPVVPLLVLYWKIERPWERPLASNGDP